MEVEVRGGAGYFTSPFRRSRFASGESRSLLNWKLGTSDGQGDVRYCKICTRMAWREREGRGRLCRYRHCHCFARFPPAFFLPCVRRVRVSACLVFQVGDLGSGCHGCGTQAETNFPRFVVGLQLHVMLESAPKVRTSQIAPYPRLEILRRISRLSSRAVAVDQSSTRPNPVTQN
ncbi:hypothetical protein Hypma_014243 [Hypsizygus marmoreus]|uniref:Uncharacterized protein n=1 Tax=Hypsizygus marmoreus TaxID=39966 RepID=A0A369JAJ8_HYPMA|nr:hypothetical protein Hypma_014243 [Hypsizygus marmoreus]